MPERTTMHAPCWGYACFLTVNATSTWGGVFPFLPIEFQTAEVTLTFFLTQALAFGSAFLVSAIASCFMPHEARRMMVLLTTSLVFAGSASLIAAMYVPFGTLAWVAGSGALLGVGSAGYFMLWQRYFSSLAADEGSLRLMLGTLLAPLLYFALTLVPIAVTAFLIPLVFIPLCALCISLCVREMRFDQPMFEDIPLQHPNVYRQVLADYWRNALCLGALAMISGVIRGIALQHGDIFTLVNSASVVGLFVSAAMLLGIWYRFGLHFGMTAVFRVTYPVLATGFLLLPFLGSAYLNLFAAVTYLIFSLVQMLMMMQCAQISRDRGINPVFIYGFIGGVMYIAQSAGFLLGWMGDGPSGPNQHWLFALTVVCSYVLGLTLLVSTGNLLKPKETRGTVTTDPIELASLRTAAGTLLPIAENPSSDESRKHRRKRASASPDADAIRDLLSKKCLALQEQYGLSTREREVAELLARGNSVAAIAERLVISENTVRTHAKHIYTKLDIHKRQELLDLLG